MVITRCPEVVPAGGLDWRVWLADRTMEGPSLGVGGHHSWGQ